MSTPADAPPLTPCYVPRRAPLLRTETLRGWCIGVREWPGRPGGPTLFLLHGWADFSATFQFLADQLPDDWRILAPDLRGFGNSQRSGATYWFAEYLADLEALLNATLPEGESALLADHSLGGNIVSLYAGLRPQRVRALIALDAFGLPDMGPKLAPKRLTAWLDQMAKPVGFNTYRDHAALATRLRMNDPRIPDDRLHYLAHALGVPGPDGRIHLNMDPAHRYFSPALYRAAEAQACWRQVTAPTLWVVQADPSWRRALGVSDEQYAESAACFRDLEEVRIEDCGHNLHHTRPEAVAAAIQRFLTRRVLHPAATYS